MSRIAIPARDAAPAASKPLLDAVEAQIGTVPNAFKLIGSSPAVLEGFLAFSAALGKTLDVKTRNRIALATADANACDYCLSAHTYLGTNVAKLDEEELALNRLGRSKDSKADAAVSFAAKVVQTKGKVSNDDIAALRLAGFSDAQAVEIVANVAVNVFTNFLNNVAQTDIDFPVVRARAA
jgi:uncharacterized peroxidase-related enzyme